MNRFLLVVVAWLSAVTAHAQEPAPDPRAGVFSADFPYESKYVEVEGEKLHYIDQGEGQIFLFLHGNPTSSYLWRNVMRYVESSGRIIAVDNIGFGKSAQPELDYTYQTHYRFIEAFIRKLELSDLILVVHDWGSVIGLDYARQHEANVRGVVFMEAIIPPGFPMADLTPLGGPDGLFAKFRTPDAGKELLIDQNVFVEQLLVHGALTRELSDAEADAYREPFLDPASRFPIYVWPNELPIAAEPRATSSRKRSRRLAEDLENPKTAPICLAGGDHFARRRTVDGGELPEHRSAIRGLRRALHPGG